MPSNRLLREVMRRDDPFSTIGWFRTPEREAFGRFSRALYRDKPLALLARTTIKPLFKDYSTLAEVLSDSALTLGVISDFSYGPGVDAALAASNAPREVVVGGQSSLVKMLGAGRISYLLSAPEEIPVLIREAGLNEEDFFILPLEDLPRGNTRHFLYGSGVDPAWIARIDQAILEICGDID